MEPEPTTTEQLKHFECIRISPPEQLGRPPAPIRTRPAPPAHLSHHRHALPAHLPVQRLRQVGMVSSGLQGEGV